MTVAVPAPIHEPAPAYAPAPAPTPGRPRVASVDVLRGLVMVIMALDHVRDFLSNAAFQPTDMAQTTPAYFFTRWITHFCAPAFMFLAGTSAFLSGQRRTTRALSWFLLSRGAWLIIAELTILRFALSFDITSPLLLIVIWALGASMIVLAALIHLPRWAIAAIALAMIAGHNLLDGITAGRLVGPGLSSAHASAFDWIWSILHVQNFPVLYPLIPWVGVMAAGYAFGPMLLRAPPVRARQLTRLGLVITAGFLVLRAINAYGDPSPWDATRPVLSFLNTTKYPPSLLFLMMTLGPTIAFLPRLERLAPTVIGRVLAIYGRVPFFYYAIHLYVIHLVAIALTLALHGKVGAGFDLWVVYAVWIAIVAALYPLCRWFAGVKARRHDAWLSYL